MAYYRWNSSIENLESVDACIAKMHNNESDFLPIESEYPFPDTLVKNLPIDNQLPMMILSSYRPVDMVSANLNGASVLFTVTSFSPATIIWTTITMALLVVLLKLYSRITYIFKLERKKSKSAIADVCIGITLRQASSCYAGVERKRNSFRLVYFLFVYFMFMIHFYFASFIETERVITEKPDIIDSYQKVLDRKDTRPYWFPYVRDFARFMNAEPGSMEQQVWHKAGTMDASCHQDYTKCLYPMTADTVTETVMMLSRGEGVLIAGYAATMRVFAALCPMAKLLQVNPMIMRRDRDSEGLLKSLVYNSRMDKEVYRVVFIRARRTLESGISAFMAKCASSPMEELVTKESVRVCMANVPTDHDPVLYNEGLSDFIYEIMICSFSLLAAVFLHTFQVLTHHP